jgi:hypothetical protein
MAQPLEQAQPQPQKAFPVINSVAMRVLSPDGAGAEIGGSFGSIHSCLSA